MLRKMEALQSKVDQLGLNIRPKAIYVCKTNINQEDGTVDDPAKEFDLRKAPPILIWKHLVKQGIDPTTIAVYCDLKFVKDFPPPDNFILFSQGEKDFEEFQKGDFRHIIFNLSLQEGWDDPDCYFAYIDKSMESTVQVEQVIGRVLRQPGATHYPDADLNTAHFYIRMDDRTIFPEILQRVRSKIAAQFPEVDLDTYTDNGSGSTRVLEPVKEIRTIPQTHIDATDAIKPLERLIRSIHDYLNDVVNTVGQGMRSEIVQKIASDERSDIVTTMLPQTNRVTARWVIDREIQKLYPRARGVCLMTDPKFDAKIQFTSPAYLALRESGENIVDTYLDNSILVSDRENLYTVGPIMVNPDSSIEFTHALHSRYSGLNSLEVSFAKAIDALGYTWVRNPSNGGYCIPLLMKSTNRNFYPDFLVWKNDVVYALDPKADDLIIQDAGRKLFDIRDFEGHLDIAVRLFTKGEWTDNPINKTADRGYTVWALRAGRIWARHFLSIEEAVQAALS
jgi:type III restriction enzyme